MNGTYRQNGRRVLSAGLLAGLLTIFMAAPGGAAHAGGGGSTFEWCPAPLGHGDPACSSGTGVQDVVNKAQAAHVPGTIYINAGTFTESVTATGLKDVFFQGDANLGGQTVLSGLTITSSKNIKVFDFVISNVLRIDKGSGVYLLNGNSGPLLIANSKFDGNKAGAGLVVMHDGPVSLQTVSASKNAGVGMVVGASGPIHATDITASSNGLIGGNLAGNDSVVVDATKSKGNHFDLNGTVGLVANANSAVVVMDTFAARNQQEGLRAVSSTSTILISVQKTKMSRFDRNGLDGLYAATPGSVILYDVSASSNGGDGVNVPTGPSSITFQPIVSKAMHFDRNKGHGIEASTSGTIMLADIFASRNGGDGAHLGSGTGITVVTHLSRLNYFDRNGGRGITATTSGYIDFKDVSASSNLTDGAFIGSGTYTSIGLLHGRVNLFDRNQGHGLTISAGGGISLLDLSASSNTLDGAHLGSGSAVHVVTSFSTNKFDLNGGSGMTVSAGDDILILDTSASKNHVYGLDLTTSGDAATLTCSVAKNNLVHDIRAALGSANLNLNSVTMTHPGQSDVSFLGTGVMMVATVGCS